MLAAWSRERRFYVNRDREILVQIPPSSHGCVLE